MKLDNVSLRLTEQRQLRVPAPNRSFLHRLRTLEFEANRSPLHIFLRYGRLNVSIGDDDPLGSFVFRTTGFNSIRTLAARLQYFQAISGNRLSCIPLELRLRGKSTRQSHGTPIYYVDLTVRTGMALEDALLEAKRIDEVRQAAGFDQVALEVAARQGLSNGAFEDSEDEGDEVVEEFFPPDAIPEGKADSLDAVGNPVSQKESSLLEKLERAGQPRKSA